jgi:hypothetical protein
MICTVLLYIVCLYKLMGARETSKMFTLLRASKLTLFHIWQRRNKLSSPLFQLFSKLPTKNKKLLQDGGGRKSPKVSAPLPLIKFHQMTPLPARSMSLDSTSSSGEISSRWKTKRENFKFLYPCEQVFSNRSKHSNRKPRLLQPPSFCLVKLSHDKIHRKQVLRIRASFEADLDTDRDPGLMRKNWKNKGEKN